MAINHISNEGARPVRLPKPCKYCGGLGHLAFGCYKKPSKPLQAKKRIRRVGKVTEKWMETRKRWLENNRALYFFCHYCNRMMTRGELTLDHYKSRGRHPELRYVLKNLVPCCAPCNEDKGSLNGDEYLEKLRRS